MQHIKSFFRNDKLAENLGIEIVDVSKGRAKVRMEIQDRHRNAIGTVHGGAIFSMADFAFAVASNSHGTVAVAINANISYLKAETSGTLFAEATEISQNPKLASYTVPVTNDKGELVAIFQGMVYRKKESLG